MSKTKTIKFTLDNEVVFRLVISGSDEIVDRLVNDAFFSGTLRDAAQMLIKKKVASSNPQAPATAIGNPIQEGNQGITPKPLRDMYTDNEAIGKGE